jgi:putative ABC transport system permease protein
VLTAHVVVSGPQEALAIEERVAQIPGVRGAGFISLLPLQNFGWGAGIRVNGRADLHPTQLTFVTPGYFQAMKIPLRAGRTFVSQDRAGTPRVIVVNEALAREYFSGEDPVGRETDRGTIIGVVGDVRNDTLGKPAKPETYSTVSQNFAQVPSHGSTLVVRGDRAPIALVSAIRAAIREITPGQALFRVDTMQGVIEASLADARLYAWLVGIFAAMGLLLAMTGIYGVIAYLVALRTREFGIRMALGADAGRVLRLVMRHGLWLTVLGLVGGLGLAVLATRVLRSVLYGIAATDPVTFVAMGALLAIAALAAYWVPAHRASRVDPSTALREG